MTKHILPAILSCSGYILTDTEKRFFAKHKPVGINLFARNIQNKEQIKKLISEIKQTIESDDILIAIDQEGGRVRRLTEPEFRSYAAAIDIGKLPFADACKAAKLHASLISADFQELGINVNYAPVLDIAYPQTSEALKSRCFGSTPELVTALGKQMINTYLQNGILPCIKHIPGHGRSATDPHLHLPFLNYSLAELETDFLPFRQLNQCPLGMTAHIVIPEIDSLNPLTHSSTGINKIIRQTIGFDGFLISDAIDMKALQGTSGQKAARAISAGCDAICYALGNIEEMQDIAASLPPLSDISAERLSRAKKLLNNKTTNTNIEAQAQEYQSIMKNVSPYQETYDATEVLNHLLQNTNHKGD